MKIYMSGSTVGLHTNTSIVIVMINLQISLQQQQPSLFIWGRLEMKLIGVKNRDKTKVKRSGEKKGNKNNQTKRVKI
jgi:hypothetical protein